MSTAEFQSKYPTWPKTLSPEEKAIKRLETHSYWNDKGRYQNVYDKLSKLIPECGMADTTHVEALRCITNIYYDVYNNGGGNLYERHIHDAHDGGEYYEYYTYTLNDYYADMVVKVTCFIDGEPVQWWRNADNTEFGEAFLESVKQGGYMSSSKTLVLLETIMDQVIKRAYGIEKRND